MINKPIPISGVAQLVRPIIEMPIALYSDPKLGINWQIGTVATKSQLEAAILISSNEYLPNGFLPSLCPGDVVILQEGKFWITTDWEVKVLDN
jgi:hypothetical protein